MLYQIVKQFIAVDDQDPSWATRNVWVAVLPELGDRLDVYQTYERAEEEVIHKIELNQQKDENGNDQRDKFGKKIKARRYKIIEIEVRPK